MPLNPDDIRARAEAVGYRINHCLEGYEIWVPDDRFHPPERLLIIFRDYDKSFQAALDLIEAEERRQACEGCGGHGKVKIISRWGKVLIRECPDCKGTGERP